MIPGFGRTVRSLFHLPRYDVYWSYLEVPTSDSLDLTKILMTKNGDVELRPAETVRCYVATGDGIPPSKKVTLGLQSFMA